MMAISGMDMPIRMETDFGQGAVHGPGKGEGSGVPLGEKVDNSIDF